MNPMLKQFNLPNYIDGLSFADASKKIQSRFKERTDQESVATERDMLERLKQMQEHVKAQQEQQEATPPSGDMRAEMPMHEELAPEGLEEMPQEEPQEQFAFGGLEQDFDPHVMPDTAPQRFAPTIGANNASIGESIMSLAGTANTVASNKSGTGQEEEKAGGIGGDAMNMMSTMGMFAFGGEEDYYKRNNPYFTTNPGQVPGPQPQQDTTKFTGNTPATASIAPQTNESVISGIGKKGVLGYAQAGVTALELGKEAFGPTGVDTSGRVRVEKKKAGNSALSGAAKGASAGMVLGPWGAAAGAVIGGAAGFIGAKKQHKDAAIANRNATYADAAVNDNQFAEGGNVDGKKKDVRRTSESLVIKPISELGHTINRVVPTNTGKLKYSKSSDPEYNSARKEFVDWYSNSATKEKFAKNTGYDPERLYDMTSKATSTPSHKGDAYKQPPVGAKAIFNTPDVGGKKEEIIYHGGIGSGPIQHELTHAGAMANILGPSLLRTLGSPKNQKLPSDINDPNFKSASNSAKEYLSIPEEAYGNFHEFRINLGLKPGEKIDKNNLRKRVKEKNLQNENFYSTFEDDKIVDAINKIAYNDNKEPQYQAAMGGNVNQFHEGGEPGHTHKPAAKPIPKVKPKVKTAGYRADGKFIKPKISTEMDADLMSLIKKDIPSEEVSGIRAKFEKYYDDEEAKKPKSFGNKVKDAILDNKEALRYAPALGNMLQLAQLKMPEQETTPELNTRYKKNIVDEQGLANLVKEETAATREAILGASEGSGNAARANLLAVQLGGTKALSDAFMKSTEANNRENTQEQAFNLGIDTTNLQQQTLAQDIRARNKGVHDTEKSRLMAAVATELGSIGQEELYKKFPELMGADYDFKGRYVVGKKKKTENKSKF